MRKLFGRFAAILVVAYLLICALLYFTQDAYLYYPTGRDSSVPSFVLRRDDARIVVSTNGVESDRAVLYFGGNGEDVSRSVSQLSRAFPGESVHAMHYRSYGGSTGKPSERALVADAVALYDGISAEHPRVSIVGRSLGSGVAIQLAAARKAQRLVLVTPYYSIADVASRHFRWFPVQLILRDKYESWRHVAQLRLPTTLIVAGKDQMIPNDSSESLARAFSPGVAELIVIPEADHNDVSDFPEYTSALRGVN